MTDTVDRTEELMETPLTEEGAVEAPQTTTRTISRAALALAHLAASDDSRPVLGQVHIAGDEAMAADGVMCGWVGLPPVDPDDASKTPPTGQVGVPTKTALKALRKTSAKEPDAVLEATGERVLITAKANEEEPIAGQGMTDYTYPNLHQIVPKTVPQAVVHLSVSSLKKLVAFFEAGMNRDAKATDNVELRVHGPRDATEWRAETADGEPMTALLMPMVFDVAGEASWLHEPVEGVAPNELLAYHSAESLETLIFKGELRKLAARNTEADARTELRGALREAVALLEEEADEHAAD